MQVLHTVFWLEVCFFSQLTPAHLPRRTVPRQWRHLRSTATNRARSWGLHSAPQRETTRRHLKAHLCWIPSQSPSWKPENITWVWAAVAVFLCLCPICPAPTGRPQGQIVLLIASNSLKLCGCCSSSHLCPPRGKRRSREAWRTCLTWVTIMRLFGWSCRHGTHGVPPVTKTFSFSLPAKLSLTSLTRFCTLKSTMTAW